MSVNNEGMSPLEQMNRIMSDKEAVIDSKLEQLRNEKKELAEFKAELKKMVDEIKNEKLEIATEKEAIKKAWDEIHMYEKSLESSMEQVLAEKVLIEQRSMSDLKRLLDEDVIVVDPQGEVEKLSKVSQVEEEFDLNALRRSIGMDVPNFGTTEVSKEENVKEEICEESNVQADPKEVNPIPEVFLNMEREITKSHSKWNRLELLPERYCLQVGDKEIRFFDADKENPVPRVEIIVFRKNAKMDKRLMNNIVGIERVAPDWSITVEDNQLVCTMQFTAETKPSVVLKKCNDFIKNHLN